MVALILISAGYGGGFALLPSLLSDIYGNKNISKIHGTELSAWSMAGLCGNQLAMFVQRNTGSYMNVFKVTAVLYLIALTVAFINLNKTKTD
jgi:OFA family oxalate/formate antiporter-like MFS transporter